MDTLAEMAPNLAPPHPAAEASEILPHLPARRAVCVLLDAQQRPVQVLAWANPRAGLKRRLGQAIEAEPSRRIPYGDLVRSVRWRPVDSPFESDLWQAALVRAAFPGRWRELLTLAQPWFVRVRPEADFPRWTPAPRPRPGELSIGPLPDRGTAVRLLELLEDLFDLCRYYPVLLQAPHGRPCAYKDMGRCSAPCDGSGSLADYRRAVAESARALLEPGEFVRGIERQMAAAATQLRFEAAGLLKARLQRARDLQQADLAWADDAQRTSILSIQPGGAPGCARLFHLNLAGAVTLGDYTRDTLPDALADAHRAGNARGGGVFDWPSFAPAMRHLFGDARRRRRWVRCRDLTESWLRQHLDEWAGEPSAADLAPGDEEADNPATEPSA